MREIAGAELDVEYRVEEVCRTHLLRLGSFLQEPARSRQHQLHQAAGAGARYGEGIEVGLHLDHRSHQRRVQAVATGFADDGGHHPAPLIAPQRRSVLHEPGHADALRFPQIGELLLRAGGGERLDARRRQGKIGLRAAGALVRPARRLDGHRGGEGHVRQTVVRVRPFDQSQHGAGRARAAGEGEHQRQRTAPAGRRSTASRHPPPDCRSRDPRPPRRRPSHHVSPEELRIPLISGEASSSRRASERSARQPGRSTGQEGNAFAQLDPRGSAC